MACTWCIRLPLFATMYLYIFLIVYSTHYVSSYKTNQSFQEISESKKMKLITEYLNKINKPANKTIKSPDGDLIDCVPFNKQPAFDNPLFNGKIPMEPLKRSKRFSSTLKFQLWNANGEECPKGTIPIRRTRKKDILSASSIEIFGTKLKLGRKNNPGVHEYALLTSPKGHWTRAKAKLGIWAPRVVGDEMSLSQIWLVAGSGNEHNSIEAGWHVYPRFYTEAHAHAPPRLFIYWTNDNYRSPDHYNLFSPGFVQLNDKIVLGAASSTVSIYNGTQFPLDLCIEKGDGGNWWLYLFHNNIPEPPIGFWPANLFTHLRDHATWVQFGGEIVNERTGGQHTITQMGSGHFSSEGWRKAAFISNIEYQGHPFSPDAAPTLIVTNPNCYDARRVNFGPEYGLSIFFGGPGRGPGCP